MRSLFSTSSKALSAVTLALLAGCSGLQSPTPAPAPAAEPPAASAASEATQGSFEPATLYALLVAEIAGQRGLPRVSLHNYLQEAERTRDVAITRHAAHIAAQLKDTESLLRAALIWADIEPANPAPYRLAAGELIKRGDHARALPLLETALRLNDTPVVDVLVERVEKMSAEELDAYRQLMDQLLTEQPQQPRWLYTKAALLRLQPELEPALTLVQDALAQEPDFDRAILLEADLQARSGHVDTALSHLREELRQRDHKQMRTLYLRLLLEKQQYPLAEQQAQLLVANHPGDHNLTFYVGALLMENGRLDAAEGYFEQLAMAVGSNSTLHYYLGRIAQQREDRAEALAHYTRVSDAPYLLPSQAEIGRLLDQPEDRDQLTEIYSTARQQHPAAAATLYALEGSWLADKDLKHAAMLVYNEGVSQFPDDTRLRYNRAMLGEQLDDLALLESDLRHLLELEPDNAMALNALGYSLTDRTDRHPEALKLISRALELKPDDPAILDSMGWVHFNLGQLDIALDYLQRAYTSFPDPEIATHLGKAYWALGRTQEAMAVWQEALERDPDSQLLLDAVAAVQQDTPTAKP
ncbi:tetratricopeptide repeat protein [Motiliproteus sediminis]|uniref:tetratricopeptide repeat protein n=1 Tax=Motiliproteus sediminis TaxID=1468178 RepID=UPI001AEF6F9B|nr:tetratricopeptide repeat protein [Motiliproteus sediminis]